MARSPQLPLLLADESAGAPFVVGSVLRLPQDSIGPAVQAIGDIKRAHGIAPRAKIHCRVLFAGSARLKSPFKHLRVDDCHTMLTECVDAMLRQGGQWTGCYVHADSYPKELRLLEGETFPVTTKHLAGIVTVGAIEEMARITDNQYQLAFDADPSMVDWGLLNRTQATNFARINAQAIVLDPSEQCLLEMADIAAYTLVQSLLCQYAADSRKAWHLPFAPLRKRMQMQTAEFAYRPNG
jgi:hypothetical protein